MSTLALALLVTIAGEPDVQTTVIDSARLETFAAETADLISVTVEVG